MIPVSRKGGEMMVVKRIGFVFMIMSLFVIVNPVSLYASSCQHLKAQAQRTFDDAMEASDNKYYEEAAELYDEAAEYYTEASKIDGCLCPKMKDNIRISRSNANNNRKAMRSQEQYEAEVEIVDKYREAQARYNQGEYHARKKEWKKALYAYEDALEMWESIAGPRTVNGSKARQAAQKARQRIASVREIMTGY